MTNSLPKQKLKLKLVSALLSEPEPKQEWLIENIWVDKSRGLIAGNPGVGKTWIALDMLMAVASGQPCFGKFPVRQGAVLLVEEEASETNLARRVHALARGRGLKDSDLTNFYHLTRQGAKIPRDLKEIFWMVVEHEIQLVVFDSLRRFHSGDENSSTEMQEVLDAFGRINILSGASIVLIHHLAKSDDKSRKPLFERLRGSSDLWAWRDCLIGVEGEEDAEMASCSFQFRDAETPLPFVIQRSLDQETGAISVLARDMDAEESFGDKVAMITDWMSLQLGKVSKNKIVAGVKGKRDEILKVLRYMEKKGIIMQNGYGYYLKDNANVT